MPDNIEVLLKLRDELSSAIKQTEGNVKGSTNAMSGHFKSMANESEISCANMAKAFAAGGIILEGVKKPIEAVKMVTIDSVKAFDEEIQVYERLKASIGKNATGVSAIKQTEGNVKGSTNAMSGHFKSMANESEISWANMAKAFAAGGIILEGVKKSIEAVKMVTIDSVKAFDEEIQVYERLKASIGENAKGVMKLAEGKEKLTRYTHDETLAAASALTTHKLNGEEIKKLIPVIQDYAANSGKGLVETANAFAVAIQYGSTRSLRQFGIEIDKTGSQQDIFNSLLKAGEGDVRGMAERMGDLGAGPLIRVGNQFNSMKEIIGENLMPQVRAFAQILESVIPAFNQLLIGGVAEASFSGSAGLLNQHVMEIQKIRAEMAQIKAINEGTKQGKLMFVPEGLDTSAHHLKVLNEQLKTYTEITEKPKKQEKSKLSGVEKADTKDAEWIQKSIEEINQKGSEWRLKNLEDERKKKTEEQDKNLKDEEKYAEEINNIRDQLRASGRKILANAEEKELKKTQAGRMKLLIMDQKNEMTLARKTGKDITILEKQQSEERIELARQDTKMKIQFGLDYASNTFSMLSSIADATSANADVKKRIAEGEAVVSGGKAVLGILENSGQYIASFGPVGGPIAEGVQIGLTVAQTLAQISKIESAKFARGTSFAPGGLSLVGEEGPELVNLPRGSQVLTATQTSNYLNGSGNTNVHVGGHTIVINGNADQRTVGRVSLAVQEATVKGVHQALRTLQVRGKLPGTTIFN